MPFLTVKLVAIGSLEQKSKDWKARAFYSYLLASKLSQLQQFHCRNGIVVFKDFSQNLVFIRRTIDHESASKPVSRRMHLLMPD